MNYGLIGEKLGHSFSADIHHRLCGYDYELKEISPDQLSSFIRNRDFSSINVTIPYKEQVIPLLDEVSDAARRIGAVNTIVNRNGVLYGYNTDFLGLKALIERNGISIKGKTVLVLGSGGTSKTAAAVAEDLGCRSIVRVSRTERDDCITYEQAKQSYAKAEVLINTTPCGMYPRIGESAVDASCFPALQAVVDVVYNPLRTKLVCDAQARGITAVGGLYMLVAQAAYAAERFTGNSIPEEKIERICRQLFAEKQNVVLVGMPGCGKSTVGNVLAQQLHRDFIDTDEEIVRRDGRAISDIINTDGEATFRQLESEIIRTCSARQGCVIATGGGAILNRENVDLLRENGRIYFLDRSLSLLCATADRPLSSSREALEQRYAERYALYQQACDVRIIADGDVDDVVNQIRKDLT